MLGLQVIDSCKRLLLSMLVVVMYILMKRKKEEGCSKTIIEWKERWSYMVSGVTKLIKILEGEPEPPFEADELMDLCTTVYKMCNQKPPHDYSHQLYDRYCEIIEDYAKQTVSVLSFLYQSITTF